MSYQSDLYTALTGNAGLTAVVGTNIYPDIADQTATAPYIVYYISSTRGETSHDGERTIEFPQITLTVWAKTKAQAISTSVLIDTILDGNTLAGSSDLSMIFSNRSGTYDPSAKLFGEILEYSASANIN